MPSHYTNSISEERFNEIKSRYNAFLKSIDDMSIEPLKVFDPLREKAVEELELIREVSGLLQKKKDEDVRKAAEVAEEEIVKEAEKEQTVEGEETVDSEEAEEKPETEKEN